MLNKTIIISNGLSNLDLVNLFLNVNYKVAVWDKLEQFNPHNKYYKKQEIKDGLTRPYWVDPTDKDAVELGLRNTIQTLGIPDFIVLPIEEYKRLLNNGK